MQNKFMQRAIDLSRNNVVNGGGPFGAVIVQDNRIIGEGANRVTIDHDPTAHAEIVAIRTACAALKTFNLKGCVIYTSCEPCPMCLAAIYWAQIDTIFYANTKDDAAAIGFADAHIYREFALPPEKRQIPMHKLPLPDAIKAFQAWQEKVHKTPY